MIAKEVETVYYAAQLTRRACLCEAGRFRERTLALPWGSAEEAEVLDEFGIRPRDRWDWQRVARPYGDRAFRDTVSRTRQRPARLARRPSRSR
ncbi:hypothetical protein [Streptomyces sp. NPDC055134]